MRKANKIMIGKQKESYMAAESRSWKQWTSFSITGRGYYLSFWNNYAISVRREV